MADQVGGALCLGTSLFGYLVNGGVFPCLDTEHLVKKGEGWSKSGGEVKDDQFRHVPFLITGNRASYKIIPRIDYKSTLIITNLYCVYKK